MHKLRLKILGNSKIENEKVFNLLEILVDGVFTDFSPDLPRLIGLGTNDGPKLASHLYFMKDYRLIEMNIDSTEEGFLTFDYPRITANGYNHLKLWQNKDLIQDVIRHIGGSIEKIPFELLMDVSLKVVIDNTNIGAEYV